VDDVTRLTEAHRFNVTIARFMELTSTLRKAVNVGGAGADSLRDGGAALAVMLSCFVPYAAEEAWSRLGHDVAGGDSVHTQPWPTADPRLLVEESVVCVVQVADKVRDRLHVTPQIGEDELRSLALSSDAVNRAIGDAEITRVVVRAPHLVNIVLGGR
jgi:leucyl-tRNA synthetase